MLEFPLNLFFTDLNGAENLLGLFIMPKNLLQIISKGFFMELGINQRSADRLML